MDGVLNHRDHCIFKGLGKKNLNVVTNKYSNGYNYLFSSCDKIQKHAQCSIVRLPNGTIKMYSYIYDRY